MKQLKLIIAALLLISPFIANAAEIVFDDMEHGNPFGNDWFIFFGNAGGGLDPNVSDLPPGGGTFSLQTGWGSGGTPGFFGGFGRTNPIDLTGMTHFNFWINPDRFDEFGNEQDYLLEINLQDDDNGDGALFPQDDDEFQYNCVVAPTGPCAISGGGWQQISIPLSDFFDDNSFLTGGNGVLDPFSVSNGGNGQLINVVIAVISNNGADVTFRTDNWTFTDYDPTAVPVTIDIKPGSDPTSINPESKGKIPVAILTTDTFDATQVDWESVLFGPDGATESHGRAHVQDVDGDGDTDLVLHFKTRETGIQCGDVEATLTGETWLGEHFSGSDSVRTVNCD